MEAPAGAKENLGREAQVWEVTHLAPLGEGSDALYRVHLSVQRCVTPAAIHPAGSTELWPPQLPTLPAFATCFSFCFPFCLRADDSAGSYEFLPNRPAKSVAKKVLEHLRKLLE
jgi:hypothetical protein